MALFWQKLLKTVCFNQNNFNLVNGAQKLSFCPKWLILAKTAQNIYLWAKWLEFCNNCSKLCVLTKMDSI